MKEGRCHQLHRTNFQVDLMRSFWFRL